jgi:hypothetical protein
MKKSFAFGEAVGLTPFAPFGDAPGKPPGRCARGRETPVRAASPGPTHPSGVHARARRPAARRTLRACTRGRHLPRTAEPVNEWGTLLKKLPLW